MKQNLPERDKSCAFKSGSTYHMSSHKGSRSRAVAAAPDLASASASWTRKSESSSWSCVKPSSRKLIVTAIATHTGKRARQPQVGWWSTRGENHVGAGAGTQWQGDHQRRSASLRRGDARGFDEGYSEQKWQVLSGEATPDTATATGADAAHASGRNEEAQGRAARHLPRAGGVQGSGPPSLVQDALLLRVYGPLAHLPRVLLLPPDLHLPGPAPAEDHAPGADVRALRVVPPLREARAGDLLRAPLQPRDLARGQRVPQLRVLLAVRGLDRLLRQPPAVHACGRDAGPRRVRYLHGEPALQRLLPCDSEELALARWEGRVPDPLRLPLQLRDVRELHHRDLAVDRLQCGHPDCRRVPLPRRGRLHHDRLGSPETQASQKDI